MEIQVTENKSNANRMLTPWNMVRVFVDRDFSYGYWVNEHAFLTEILKLDQDGLNEYFSASDTYVVEVDVHTAQRVIDVGATPFNKPVLPGATAYVVTKK